MTAEMKEKVCPLCGTEYPSSVLFCANDGRSLVPARQGEDLVGTVVAERYLVHALLGEGGVGRVYVAEHVRIGRRLALKVLRRQAGGLDPDSVTRFNREAANASRISHPNIATIYDFGETLDGRPYIAMELVDGPALSTLLNEAGALPLYRVAEITRQTAEALAAAHEHGIVHRDVKPGNILIAKDRDGRDLVKVVDFGIAKAGDTRSQNVTQGDASGDHTAGGSLPFVRPQVAVKDGHHERRGTTPRQGHRLLRHHWTSRDRSRPRR